MKKVLVSGLIAMLLSWAVYAEVDQSIIDEANGVIPKSKPKPSIKNPHKTEIKSSILQPVVENQETPKRTIHKSVSKKKAKTIHKAKPTVHRARQRESGDPGISDFTQRFLDNHN